MSVGMWRESALITMKKKPITPDELVNKRYTRPHV